MLILPPGHGRAIASPSRPLLVREKWLVAGVLGLLAAGVVALVISLASSGRNTGNGCIDVKVPGATGATEFYRCGSQARAMCGTARSLVGVNDVLQRALTVECRKAGIPTA